MPGLLVLVGLTQREATGTSLAALLLPVGLLGVLTYSRLGAVKLPIALLLALGMLAGTYLGSRLALSLPEVTLRRGLALLLVLVAGQLILKK